MKILFKYPTLGRPEWFKKTLQIYLDRLSGLHEYEFVISLNEDDSTMNNDEMKSFMNSILGENDGFHFGHHQTKIDAVNADMEGRDFDVLFLISDDMIPQGDNFDDVIVQHMLKYFPNMDGALHYDDGCCGKDRTITLSIMGKKLYDIFGYIYHPSYKSFYCDNEFTDVVRKLNAVQYIPEVIVKHDWQGWGKDRDKVYQRNSRLGKPDEANYNKRKSLGFPIGKD
jgi:hypothetical protein